MRSAYRWGRLVDKVVHGFALPRGSADRLPAEPWFIDQLDTTQGLTVRGWAFIDEPCPDGDYSARFAYNGHRFDRVEYPLERGDVGRAFPARRGAADCGFVLVAHAAADLYPGGVLELVCHDRATSAIASARDSWFVPDPALHADLPDDEQRFRVIGNRDVAGFLMSGCTDFHRLDGACVAVGGGHLAEHAGILDWGCGCGRIARHLAPHAPALYGCDIDADNVAWCRQHLPGHYATSSLRPPLPYADNAFDVVYGVSVFTHFRAEMEALWLTELQRVAAPGALLLVTVHGRTTVEYAQLGLRAREALLRRIEREGVLCSGRNDQLDRHATHEDEYVNVYHSEAYIRRVWGRYFDIVELLPGYLFTHDLVIMRKR